MNIMAEHPDRHAAFLQPEFSASGLDRYLPRRAVLDALRKALPRMQGRLLDIGCGQKPYRALLLSPPSKITSYTGLDLPGYTKHPDDRPDLLWDGKRIPAETASFDCAISTEVLEQCPFPEILLGEAVRVLKPGGTFFFTVPFLWPLHDPPNDQYRFSPYAMRRLLAEAGFVDITVEATGGWDASLAQMIGLWARRRPMPRFARSLVSHLTLPILRRLAAMDRPPVLSDELAGTVMITGLSGTAIRP